MKRSSFSFMVKGNATLLFLWAGRLLMKFTNEGVIMKISENLWVGVVQSLECNWGHERKDPWSWAKIQQIWQGSYSSFISPLPSFFFSPTFPRWDPELFAGTKFKFCEYFSNLKMNPYHLLSFLSWALDLYTWFPPTLPYCCISIYLWSGI